MKPVIELVIFVGFVCIIAILTLIWKEAKDTKEAILTHFEQFEYELEDIR